MSNTIANLTIVDSVGLATSGSVNGNAYIIGTQGYLGQQEAGIELVTKCVDGDILQWRITGIRPDVAVAIANFRGTAVSDNVINPQRVTVLGEPYWTSRVELHGLPAGTYQYTFDIVINGTHYKFDPFLKISKS